MAMRRRAAAGYPDYAPLAQRCQRKARKM